MAGLSIKFPIADDYQRGTLFAYDYNTKESIRSRLILLYTTQKGERFMYPEYGCDLRKHLFSPNDSITSSEIEDTIRQATARFFPSITISSFSAETEGNEAVVSIGYLFSESTLTFSDAISIRFSA